MKDQMELFENGGLKDEGGMVDKESGNKVPVGGTRKGVRDDIPAMVSEGEFVFPEDVVRYIGLDKLMQLRQKAKVGLKRMEDMGQMGNSDEATLPDDMPMDAPDLVILAGEAPKDMAEGGVVQTAAPRRLTPEIQRPERKQINFKQLMGRGFVEFKQYRNAQGATLLIPFVGGNPIYPIPSGYTLYDASTDTTDPTSPESQAETVAEEVSTAINKATGNDKDDDGPAPIPQSAFQKAGSWDMDTSGKDGKALQMWIDEASKFTNGTSTLVTGVASMFGLGLPVAAMTAREKKQILRQIDSKIAQARKTDMAGQVAALEAIKKDLTEKTTGLGSALDSLTSSVADLFGMSEQQTKTATETMNKITAIEDTIANQAPPVRPTPAPISDPTPEPTPAPSYVTMPMGEEGRGTVTTPEPTPIAVSGPTAAEVEFGAPLGDPLGGTPPPVDELITTPKPEPLVEPTPAPAPSYATMNMGEAGRPDPRLLEAAGVDVPPVLPEDPAIVPVLSQPEPAPITTGVSQVTTPSPRFGYESGQDVQQSVAPYLQGTVGGQPEFYSPPQIVTTQAQVEAPSAPQMTESETFTATLSKPDPSMDPTGVGKFPPLTPEAPSAVSPLPPTVDTTPTPAPSYATMPIGEAGRGVVSTAKGRDVDAAFDPVPTESAAPDTSLRPRARPVVREEKEVKKTVKPEPKPEPVQDKKTTRLDSTNPNTSTNIANHLSKTEKTSLEANPSLAAHYTATANRRANEAARGDTSNTDAAKEKDNKIVCTAMNNAYGFGSYRQAIWLSYSKDYLTKEHEIGYHTLFLPLVDLAYNKNNKFVRVALEHIARHRTADLRASMQNKKRNTLGRIYRCVLEPLVYTIGKFRIITGI